MLTKAYPRVGIVQDPRLWMASAGYEFWFNAGHADIVATMSASNDGLSGYGWTTTSLTVTEGSAGDFLSAADVDPTRVATDASTDLLTSPRIFGSYDHGLVASRFLGYMPTKLNAEFYAAFTTNSATELGTFIGFTGPAVTSADGTNSVAAINIGASNFLLTSDTGSDTGAAKDTSWHKFRITVDATNVEWFIDDVSQGTISTLTDIWPTCFKMIATTTNRIALSWLRVYYA